jgi:hypothetical protein
MTIEFHRLTVPTYFGGLPAGYDYVNNAVSGTPADANGVLTYGPNIGSYFIGFGDDATSADGNRPAQALSQNTDFLDNLLHTDLVQMVRTADQTVSGSPQTSITLTATAGTIWLGSGGYALQDLFHITDSLGREFGRRLRVWHRCDAHAQHRHPRWYGVAHVLLLAYELGDAAHRCDDAAVHARYRECAVDRLGFHRSDL